jgi:hypothetical protein
MKAELNDALKMSVKNHLRERDDLISNQSSDTASADPGRRSLSQMLSISRPKFPPQHLKERVEEQSLTLRITRDAESDVKVQ